MNCFCSRILQLLAIFLSFSAISLYSALPGDVVINEIAWMGSDASSSDEWMELFNRSGSDIDLTGWIIVAADGDPSINLSGTIPAGGYFLLERTDDNTVSDIPADLIYSGNLSNSGEHLQLKDETGLIVDGVDCSAGWFAGSSSPRQSMERKDPGGDGSLAVTWDTNDGVVRNGFDAAGTALNGTPGAQNSVFSGMPSHVLSDTPEVFSILSNFPNPFNPSTSIQYTVSGGPGIHEVSLMIYSLLGVPVRRLVHAWTPPGTFSIRWNGRDDVGGHVPTGVYITRLFIDGRAVQTCKLIRSN